jgi:uncharacterized membrane protein
MSLYTSIGGTVVVVIVGFVFTTTCTMNVFAITTTTVPPIDVYKDIHCTCSCKYKPFDYDYNSSSYRRCTKTFIVHVVVNTNPHCTPSIGGTVVVVIVGFVFTTTCTMTVFVHPL